MLRARIAVQTNGRIFFTISEDGKILLRDMVLTVVEAELRLNALRESRGEEIPLEIETGL